MERILITGGMGFLGSHLAQRFLEDGKEVWCLDLYEPPFGAVLREYDRFHMVVDTIKNRPVLAKLIDKVDTVCHLAAVACPDQYVTQTRKVMDITLGSGLDVVEMVRLTGKFLFFTSTSEIYGRNPSLPFREDDDRVLGGTDINRWCYSTSKAALEHYIRACHLDGQLDYVTVRVFNGYGPRLRGRVVDAFVDAALCGQPLVVHGNGQQTRCFTQVDDLIEGFVRLMETPAAHNTVYNIGNPVESTVLDLAQKIVKLTGRHTGLIDFACHKSQIGESYEDIGRRVPCIDKINEVVDWEPTIDLDDGLLDMIAYRQLELEQGVSLPRFARPLMQRTA